MQCYCSGACPEDAVNNTCWTTLGGWCFAVAVEVFDPKTGMLGPERRFGCLQPEETGYMQCQGRLSPHAVPTMIECCKIGDHCNRLLKPVYIPTDDDHLSTEYLGLNSATHLAMLISVALCLLVLACLLVVIFIRYRRRVSSRRRRDGLVSMLDGYGVIDRLLRTPGRLSSGAAAETTGAAPLSTLLPETSSASGSGKPLLAQRTVAREVALLERVGQGRYGQVYRALYQGQSVAVKVFFTLEEASWQREKLVYESCRLQHPNILGFMAADITSSLYGRGCTEMWLISEYHELGSLHDYLCTHSPSELDAMRMALSVVQGLDYLHKEVVAASVRPAVAHRDIKSKNVLVKRDGECCLADFGLAVICSYSGEYKQLNVACTRQGTRRYMAPEVLAETLDTSSFQAFKQADMYALALVFWEIANRCVTDGGPSEQYRVPYWDQVPTDPDFDDMYRCVCEQGVRPALATHWQRSQVLTCLSKLMQECWRHAPDARLSAMYVKKRLLAAELPDAEWKKPITQLI